jgi:hypothetical protein
VKSCNHVFNTAAAFQFVMPFHGKGARLRALASRKQCLPLSALPRSPPLKPQAFSHPYGHNSIKNSHDIIKNNKNLAINAFE